MEFTEFKDRLLEKLKTAENYKISKTGPNYFFEDSNSQINTYNAVEISFNGSKVDLDEIFTKEEISILSESIYKDLSEKYKNKQIGLLESVLSNYENMSKEKKYDFLINLLQDYKEDGYLGPANDLIEDLFEKINI